MCITLLPNYSSWCMAGLHIDTYIDKYIQWKCVTVYICALNGKITRPATDILSLPRIENCGITVGNTFYLLFVVRHKK